MFLSQEDARAFARRGYGAVPPPKKPIPVRQPHVSKYPEAQKAWCIEATRAGLYPGAKTCNEAVAAGAPMTPITPQPGSAAASSRTSLYVGIGIAALVVGVGGYLLFR